MSNSSQNQLGTLFGTVGLGLAVLVGGFYMLNNADEDYSDDDDGPKRKTYRTKKGEEYYDDELDDNISDNDSDDEDNIEDGFEVDDDDDDVDIDSDELPPPIEMDDKPKKRGRQKK